jgi:hypothetical protein
MGNSVQLISTVVITVATVVLAVLTFKYVRLTQMMVQEMKRSREPLVNVDFEMPDHTLRLVISNSGLSPAKNVRFRVTQDAKWIRDERGQHGLSEFPPIKNGISYLVPGRKLKFYLESPNWKTVANKDLNVSLVVDCEDESGKSFTQCIDMDLCHFRWVLFESFRDSTLAVAEAIKDAERDRRSSERIGSHARLFIAPQKACPFCGDLIPRIAKKCSHCGEWITEKEKPSDQGPSGSESV